MNIVSVLSNIDVRVDDDLSTGSLGDLRSPLLVSILILYYAMK